MKKTKLQNKQISVNINKKTFLTLIFKQVFVMKNFNQVVTHLYNKLIARNTLNGLDHQVCKSLFRFTLTLLKKF